MPYQLTILVAAFYKDFFDPPRKRQKDVGKQAGGVRFHDQVKVKAIKAKGRGRPVSSMHVVTDDNSSSASDEEDEEPISEVPDGSEDDTDIMEEELRDDESSEEEDNSGRKAMQRMNNDLFAADEEVMDDEGKPADLCRIRVSFSTRHVDPPEKAVIPS